MNHTQEEKDEALRMVAANKPAKNLTFNGIDIHEFSKEELIMILAWANDKLMAASVLPVINKRYEP
jgi:hypothetical protein